MEKYWGNVNVLGGGKPTETVMFIVEQVISASGWSLVYFGAEVWQLERWETGDTVACSQE